jgi:hypothetical protein
METKHTKGPWVKLTWAKKNDTSKRWHCRIDVKFIVTDIIATVWGNSREECEANAKLIAAAPELYSAAVKALGLLNNNDAYGDGGFRADDELRKIFETVIQKATK